MAEQRKKTDSILLRTGGKTVTLELFPSTEWPEENGGATPVDEPAPYLPCKADVSVYLDDSLKNETGSLRTEPYQKRDGRFYCQVWVYGRGVMEFCCNDVILRRVRR